MNFFGAAERGAGVRRLRQVVDTPLSSPTVCKFKRFLNVQTARELVDLATRCPRPILKCF